MSLAAHLHVLGQALLAILLHIRLAFFHLHNTDAAAAEQLKVAALACKIAKWATGCHSTSPYA